MSRFLAPYLDFMSKATDAPPEFGHAAALTCLSTVALGRRFIDRGIGGIKPNIYVMLVAGSSKDRKSTAVNTATRLMRDVEEERVGPEDFTAEGLINFMAFQRKNENGELLPQRSKLLLAMPEFGQNLSASAAYSSTMGTTLTTLYDGQDYDRVRSTTKSVFISKPRITILAACAFGMLEKYADPKEWTTGFFSRFLFVTPTTDRPRYKTPPTEPAREADLLRQALKDIAQELAQTAGPMSISADAERMIDGLGIALPHNEDDPAEVAQRERLLNAVWKLAMLYEIDRGTSHMVSAESMNMACYFAVRSWDAFKRVYAATGTDEFGRLYERVRKYVTVRGTVSQRDLTRAFTISVSKLLPVIDSLVKSGEIRMEAGTRNHKMLVANE